MRSIRWVMVLALAFVAASSGCGTDEQAATTTTTTETVSTTVLIPVTTTAVSGLVSSTTAGTMVPAATTSSLASAAPTTNPPDTAVPGDVTTSTEPAQLDELVLRADGIGPFDFGSDWSSATSWFTQRLGPATVVDLSEWPGLGLTVRAIVLACERQEVLSWPSAGLTVGFSDLTSATGDCRVDLPGSRLWAWTLTVPRADGPRLHTEDGIAVGDTVAELRSAMPATVFMALNDGTFFPAGFYTPEGEYGVLAWDWVTDLQRALDDNGAQLVVDGKVGPKTRAAVEHYRSSHGLDSVEAVLRALVEPPDGARVEAMSSGGWFWEFECGTLEPWGWGGC